MLTDIPLQVEQQCARRVSLQKCRQKLEKNLGSFVTVKNYSPVRTAEVTFSHYKMQFDHVPCRGRADKTNTWNSWTWERILKEMDKCDLVCGNCHLARTWQRRENRLIL